MLWTRTLIESLWGFAQVKKCDLVEDGRFLDAVRACVCVFPFMCSFFWQVFTVHGHARELLRPLVYVISVCRKSLLVRICTHQPTPIDDMNHLTYCCYLG